MFQHIFLVVSFYIYLPFISRCHCISPGSRYQANSSVPVNIGPVFFRSDYKLDKEAKMFYKLHTIMDTWYEAVNICAEEGAMLATPKNARDAKFLRRYMLGSSRIWVGIHESYADGVFTTIDGKPYTDVFTNWGYDEPIHTDDSDCVKMDRRGIYSILQCEKKSRFICSRDQATVEVNNDCETYDLAYKYKIETDHCYKFHTTPKSWYAAFRICNSEQSSLAVINNEDEAVALVEEWETYPVDSIKGKFNKDVILLDFSDIITEGTYLTSKGQTLEEAGHSEWSPGKPDDVRDDSDEDSRCGAMLRDGKLTDLDCTNGKALFFCKKPLMGVSIGSVFNLKESDSPSSDQTIDSHENDNQSSKSNKTENQHQPIKSNDKNKHQPYQFDVDYRYSNE